jgi:TolB-like protein/DNA-binding winged helix-turn-helix (wHTH) protein/Tfp pilus assembly protein PilF
VTDFRFGRFEIDSRTRELRKDGVRLRLQDQPFSVLALMVEHPGELLTRDELRDRLWPDGTFVDFEHGLNAAVKRLRSVLGDNAERPRFVETLHRRGYRFIARVERVNGIDGSPALANVIGGSDIKQRLAVLPFIHLGEASAPDSFAGGLTEELITQLGRLCADRLGVIARSSCMRVQRTNRTVREIGDALRARYLVEGTVRTDADRVRITAQLIDTRSETQLWAESYERPMTDSLMVQSDVATQIVRSVAVELLPDRAPTALNGTRHIDAYQSYLKGRFHWNRSGDEGLSECLAFYTMAVKIDPRFATAHGAMARATAAAADYYLREPRAAFDAAEASASRALAIDPTESEAHVALAEVRRCRDWDWDGAEEAYRRALMFNPSNEGARRLYGVFLGARRQNDAAFAMTDRAMELDPLCLVAGTSAAWVRYVGGHYDDVVERCRHTIDMDANFLAPHRLLAAARLQMGDVNGSVQYLDSVPAAQADPTSLAWLAHALGVKGERGRATNILCHLDELAQERYVSFYHRALAHTGIGDFDAAFAMLTRACDERDPWLMHLASEPRFAPIWSDARYTAVISRLGLNQEAIAHA